jgi:hypothetical protein
MEKQYSFDEVVNYSMFYYELRKYDKMSVNDILHTNNRDIKIIKRQLEKAYEIPLEIRQRWDKIDGNCFSHNIGKLEKALNQFGEN